MITRMEREKLTKTRAELYELPNFAGFDCNGHPLYFGDKIVVEAEEILRENDPKYAFCGIGKEGTIGEKKANQIEYSVSVKFEGHSQLHGCIDRHLRKIAN